MCHPVIFLLVYQFNTNFWVIAAGFAFIEFEDARDAEDAVRDLDGRYVCGVRIRVELAKNSSRFVRCYVAIVTYPEVSVSF